MRSAFKVSQQGACTYYIYNQLVARPQVHGCGEIPYNIRFLHYTFLCFSSLSLIALLVVGRERCREEELLASCQYRRQLIVANRVCRDLLRTDNAAT